MLRRNAFVQPVATVRMSRELLAAVGGGGLLAAVGLFLAFTDLLSFLSAAMRILAIYSEGLETTRNADNFSEVVPHIKALMLIAVGAVGSVSAIGALAEV